MMLITFLTGALYSFTGIVAGLMSGMIGIGGGIIIVPALLFIFQYIGKMPADLAIHLATGTSLAIILFISQATVRAHYRQGTILWSAFLKLAPGIFMGAFVGVLLSNYLPVIWLERILAFFLLLIAIERIFNFKLSQPTPHYPPTALNILISFFIGLISGLLGIGGGVLIIPYLSYCGLNIKKITPIAALCIMTAAIVGTIMFIVIGFSEAALPAYSTGYVYWPAVLCVALPSIFSAFWGAKLTYLLSQKHLEYVFIVILLITSIQLAL
ncbi:permease [Legionella busanensis]|uniref:Probable membrane transporter protein n=1 Tax=Legionella busanensis TaxID=190655 RepID=A0A378JRN3_9GAMM|nr:sulfite exporter TauE/SafE family protein [Legionella busanensis]STX52893.1 permease [Legionella busanensis]